MLYNGMGQVVCLGNSFVSLIMLQNTVIKVQKVRHEFTLKLYIFKPKLSLIRLLKCLKRSFHVRFCHN